MKIKLKRYNNSIFIDTFLKHLDTYIGYDNSLNSKINTIFIEVTF